MVRPVPMRDISTRALVVREAGAPFVLTDIILDGIRDNEVLVEMKYTGLCHTVRIMFSNNGHPNP